jgi:hypothetical protein
MRTVPLLLGLMLSSKHSLDLQFYEDLSSHQLPVPLCVTKLPRRAVGDELAQQSVDEIMNVGYVAVHF